MLNSNIFTIFFAHNNKIDVQLLCSLCYLSFTVSVFYCLCFLFFSEISNKIDFFLWLYRSFSGHIFPSSSWSFKLPFYFCSVFSSLAVYLYHIVSNEQCRNYIVNFHFSTDGIIQPWRDSPVWDSQVINILILVF